jgi:hypothetical protein
MVMSTSNLSKVRGDEEEQVNHFVPEQHLRAVSALSVNHQNPDDLMP